jgi:hypothetical protein
MAFESREGVYSGVCRDCSELRSQHDGSCACNSPSASVIDHWNKVADAAGPAEDVGQTVVEKPERIPECSQCSKSLTDKDANHATQFGYGHNQCTTCAHRGFMEQGDVNPVKGCSECRKLGSQMSGWGELRGKGAQPDSDPDTQEMVTDNLLSGSKYPKRAESPRAKAPVEYAGPKNTASEHPHDGTPDPRNCNHCSNLMYLEISHRYGHHDEDMHPKCPACQKQANTWNTNLGK